MSNVHADHGIYPVLAEAFDPLTIDKEEIDKIIEKLKAKDGGNVSKLPEIVRWFVKTQRDVYFSDILYFLEDFSKLPPKALDIVQRMMAFDPENVTIFDLLDYFEEKEDRNALFTQLSKFYDLNTIIKPSIDTEKMTREGRTFFSQWRDLRDRQDLDSYSRISLYKEQKFGYKFLFAIERKNVDFRRWLEEQKTTIRIKKRFEELGLNYAQWDNPNKCFGFVEDKGLQEVKIDQETLKERIKKLSTELTKGKYMGYLTVSPKVLWHEIKQWYKKLDEDKDVRDCSSHLLKIFENKLRPGALKKGTPIAREFYQLGNFLETNNIPSVYDFTFFYKVWARQPSKDFCQGNDAGVCVGIGSENGVGMIHYLLDKTISLVDIYRKGRRCGQQYLVSMTTEDDESALLLDSLEASKNEDILDRINSLSTGSNQLLHTLAKRCGFKKIITNSNVFWPVSKGYRDFLINKGFSEEGIYLSKIEDVKPLKVIPEGIKDGCRYLGYKHYLDSFKDCFNFGWFDYLQDMHMKGIIEYS